MTSNIDIIQDHPLWHKSISNYENITQEIILRVLEELFPKINFEVSVLLTNDEKIKELNLKWRDKNKPTNVLSFPLFNPSYFINDVFNDDQEIIHIGDMALSIERLIEESEKQNKDLIFHFSHLLVHGTLHLLGYDHQTDEEAEKMESLEIKILSYFNYSNPYST